MYIKAISLTNEAQKENDYRNVFCIDVDGEKEISVSDGGEPEDNSLHRNLSFVYSIIPLMRKAFEAGKNGEKFEIEDVKLNDIEEFYE